MLKASKKQREVSKMKEIVKKVFKEKLLKMKEEGDLLNNVFCYYGPLSKEEIEAIIADLGYVASCYETLNGSVVVSITDRYYMERRRLIDYITSCVLYSQFKRDGVIVISCGEFDLSLQEIIDILEDLRSLNLEIKTSSDNKLVYLLRREAVSA